MKTKINLRLKKKAIATSATTSSILHKQPLLVAIATNDRYIFQLISSTLAGILIVKIEPFPSSLSTVISPPISKENFLGMGI